MKFWMYGIWIGFILCSYSIKAQYNIQVTTPTMAGKKVILAYRLEDKILQKDTLILDAQGKGRFQNETQKLARGMYLLVFTPSSSIDILIGDDQTFSLKCDTTDLLKTMQIEGSPENTAFLAFQRYMMEQNRQARQWSESYQKDPEKDKEEIKKSYAAKFEEMDKKNREYVQNLVKQYPGSALATFANFTLSPEVPDFSKIVPADTQDRDLEIRRLSWFYTKSHFWDYTNFQDSTLIRTHLFRKQLDHYFNNLVAVHPDSLYNACVEILEKSRPCTPMFKYLMQYCLFYTFDNKIMGMDEAFVKLGERYYLSGIVNWMSKEDLKKITDEVYKRMYNLLHHKAVELKLPDIDGKWVSLYETKAPFLLLLFWEPNCGHCKKQIPLAKKEIYDRFSPYGLKVFAVNTRTNQKEWEEFIEKNNLFDFINCWDPHRQSNYTTYYNVYSTPTMYILDKDKKFIAKSLAVEQMVDLLKNEYKKIGVEIP